MSSFPRSQSDGERALDRSTPARALTPLQLAVLEWVSTSKLRHARPEVRGVSAQAIDDTVADLVAAGLVNAVAVPRRATTSDLAHWEPTTITLDGRQAMADARQAQRAVHRPWWSRLFGRSTPAAEPDPLRVSRAR